VLEHFSHTGVRGLRWRIVAAGGTRRTSIGGREAQVEPVWALQALLETIQAWLELARDEEVLALHSVVRAEMTRRGLRDNSLASEGSDQPADPCTPSKNTF
jgi:hypothetical protein